MKFSKDQSEALQVLEKTGNVFLTGKAGTGKSYVINKFIEQNVEKVHVVASTAAAAMIVRGATLHSFFGLGLAREKDEDVVEKAVKTKKIKSRIKNVHILVIDEISMISGRILNLAEMISRKCRGNDQPWGGMRIIAVGDFGQLPPIRNYNSGIDWAFYSNAWKDSGFKNITLNTFHRAKDEKFLTILDHIREGNYSEDVRDYLNSKKEVRLGEATRLFARKDNVENFNLQKLALIDSPLVTIPTLYNGEPKALEKIKNECPIPEVLQFKVGALVMVRKNDPVTKAYNGMLGTIESIENHLIYIRTMQGKLYKIEKTFFELVDPDGLIIASAYNFPLTLAYAMTIHKSQGASIDRLHINIKGLWEPGQAYVALSRVRDPNFLSIEDWDQRSIIADPSVKNFHASL